jgi:hypothetical protein
MAERRGTNDFCAGWRGFRPILHKGRSAAVSVGPSNTIATHEVVKRREPAFWRGFGSTLHADALQIDGPLRIPAAPSRPRLGPLLADARRRTEPRKPRESHKTQSGGFRG